MDEKAKKMSATELGPTVRYSHHRCFYFGIVSRRFKWLCHVALQCFHLEF